MIFTFLLTVFLALVMGLFDILPNVPQIAPEIESAGSAVIDFVGNGTTVLSVIFGEALLAAAVVAILSMFFFSHIYFSVLWILKKIPMINVK